jgi:hypothetical protein
MKKTCDFCHCEETPDNPIGYYKINAGAWGSVCRKCKMMKESTEGIRLSEGTFLSEVLPEKAPNGMSVL